MQGAQVWSLLRELRSCISFGTARKKKKKDGELLWAHCWFSVQFSSVAQSCLTLCNPMDCSMPGLPVHHQLPEFTQTYVYWVGDAIQPSRPLLSPSLAFNISHHRGLFQRVGSLNQVPQVLRDCITLVTFFLLYIHQFELPLCIFNIKINLPKFQCYKLEIVVSFHQTKSWEL